MSVFQDLWTQIKAKLDGNATLQGYIGGPIIYGSRDMQINYFPALVVDFGNPFITESMIAVPKRKTGVLMLGIGCKIRKEDITGAMAEALKCYEIVTNALDADVYYSGKLLRIFEISGSNITKITSLGDIYDFGINVSFQTQPFAFGQR